MPLQDGTYEVTLNSGYIWNDSIDPNYEHTTHAQATVIVNANGKVLEMKRYPAS